MLKKEMCKKYFAPDGTYHSSRNHISESPAPSFTSLKINSRNEKAPSSQPHTNSCAKNKRHYVTDEECVQDLFGEKRIVSNLSLANAVGFFLWVLEFPILWWSLIRPATPIPNPIRSHRAFNTCQISILQVNVHST